MPLFISVGKTYVRLTAHGLCDRQASMLRALIGFEPIVDHMGKALDSFGQLFTYKPDIAQQGMA